MWVLVSVFVILLFKMALNCSARVLTFLSIRSLWYAFQRKEVIMLPKPYLGLNYSEVDSGFSVNENPNTLNKVSLNRKKIRKNT